MQLPDTIGVLWVCQTSQCNWVAIKVHYGYLRKCLLGWHESRLGFVYRYDTCPRFDRRYPDTLFNLVTGKSLYSFRNTSSWSTPWSHCAHYDDVLPSGPRDTSPFTRSDKSQSRFVPTQQTLSEIPVVHLYSHPVTLWRLVHPKHSYGIRELHNLMV